MVWFFANSFSQITDDNYKNQLSILMEKVIEATNSEPDSALDLCRKGIELATVSNDTISIVEFSTWLGRIYTIKADYAKALEILIQSQNIAISVKDVRGEAFSVLSQGNVFFYLI